jgi:hypothetical protein
LEISSVIRRALALVFVALGVCTLAYLTGNPAQNP